MMDVDAPNGGRSSCSPMEQPSWYSFSNQKIDKPSDGQRLNNQHHREESSGLSLSTTDQSAVNNEKTPGMVEIEAAVKFLTDVIKNSGFSKQSTENFRRALTDLLKQHYEGHWYPKDPFKGSGYRCLRVNGLMNPLLTKAAQLSGLPLKKFRHAFPVELTVWVDPGDVSVRFGEDGSIGVYYAKVGSSGLLHDHQQMEDLQNLARQAPRRAVTPPGRYQSSTVQPTTTTLAMTPGVHQPSKFHRYSPPTVASGESPPSSSFIFSPYDGKSVRINAQNVAAAYSSSNAVSPDFHQSPSRKYQAVVNTNQSSIIDRRTPPLGAFGGPSAYNQPPRPHQINPSPPRSFFGQQQSVFYNGTNGPVGDSSKNHGSAHFVESMDFDSMRRTPPTSFGGGQSQRGYDFESSPPSWWAGHQPQPPMVGVGVGEYQFYNNAHLGSAFSNNQAAVGHQRRFGAGRTADAMGVVNC